MDIKVEDSEDAGSEDASSTSIPTNSTPSSALEPLPLIIDVEFPPDYIAPFKIPQQMDMVPQSHPQLIDISSIPRHIQQ